MSNEGTLEKAIQKAIDGGWEYTGYDWRLKEDFDGNLFMQTYTSDGTEVYDLRQLSINDIIFNHDFAKTLWGEERGLYELSGDGHGVIPWQYHLQQMVTADDPIKYLGENI